MNPSYQYLINANINRAKEGTRVLEDIARFVLNDLELFKELRNLRHGLLAEQPTNIASEDLGGPSFIENNKRNNLLDLIQANALRVQEALRVLEEVSDEKHRIKSMRYKAYAIHQSLYQKSALFMRIDALKGLYLIIDTHLITQSLSEISSILNQTEVRIIQLKCTTLKKSALLEHAIALKSALNKDKFLIIYEHIDVALDIADGVHLEANEYPLGRLRKFIPLPFLIGITCCTSETRSVAIENGASYLLLAPSLIETNKSKTLNIEIAVSHQTQSKYMMSILWNSSMTAAILQQLHKKYISDS